MVVALTRGLALWASNASDATAPRCAGRLLVAPQPPRSVRCLRTGSAAAACEACQTTSEPTQTETSSGPELTRDLCECSAQTPARTMYAEEASLFAPRRPAASHLSLAMSYALPARAAPAADNRTAGATDVFSFQPINRASGAGTAGAGIAGGGMSSRRGSAVSQSRGSFSHSDSRLGGDSNLLGYTLRGAGALTSRTRSPPASPIMSPVGAAAAASPASSASSATSHASNPLSASWNAASAAASSVRAPIALDVGHAPRVALSISSMALHPAHVALTFQRGTVFCVLDAVAGPGADLSEADEDRLRAFIRRRKAVDPTGKPEGAFNSPATPLLALRTVDSVIIGLHFIPPLSGGGGGGGKDAGASVAVPTPLRLLVVQQNATYLLWEYGLATTGANGSAWQYVARGNLPSPLPAARAADAREVVQVTFHAQQQTLVWLEKQSIRSGAVHALHATQLPTLLNTRLPEVINGSRLIRTHFTYPAPSAAVVSSSSAASTAATVLHCADRGIFVAPPPTSEAAAQSLYYFSLQSQLLVRIALLSDCSRSLFAVHAQTRSLYGVDDRRRLLSFVEHGPVDTTDLTLNLFDPALYVRSKVECVLEAEAKPAPPPPAPRSRLSSSASMRPTEAEVTPPFLPTGSHLVMFGDYLALLRPSTTTPGGATSPQLRCSFYTALGGLHLSSFMLAEPAPLTSYIGEDDEDEPDSPVHSSAPAVAPGAVLRGVLSTSSGFGGSGVAMHSRRTVWWLRISPLAQQVSAMLRKRANGTQQQQQPAVSDAPLSQSARELQKLIAASQSLVPAAIGLLPPSLNSSPVFTAQRARTHSSGSSFSTLSALDSPMLSSSTHGGSSGGGQGSSSALLANSLPPSVQSHIAQSVLTPFGESAMPLRSKQQVQGLMSDLLSHPAPATATAHHHASNRLVPLRLGESNHAPSSLKNPVGEHGEMKEGGGEGQQHNPQQPQAHQSFPDLETPEPLTAPSLHKSFPQLFRILQSPALAISLLHLPTTMPSSFSIPQGGVGASSALLSPAFSGLTFDAEMERTLRDEITRYLKIMQPLRKQHARRSRHPNSRTTSGNSSVARRSSAVMNGYGGQGHGHDEDSNNSDSSTDSSSDDSSASNSPRASPTASPARRRDATQMPNGSPRKSMMNGASSSSAAAVRAQSNGRGQRSRASRTALYNCFQLYTPLSLQTLPLVQQYAAVMRHIRRLRNGGSSALAARQLSGQGEEGKQGGSTGGGGLDYPLASPSASYASHPATYIPPLPSLQQQLSKAITNRLTKLATGAAASPFNASPSSDRSFTSLVIHDASATLAYLTQLLGLQGLQQLAAQRAAGTPTASSNDLHRVLPSLLLVNEETKLRRELLQSGSGYNIASASQSFVSMSRLDALPYFETLVRLFDQLAPQLLPDFVQLMDEMFSAQRSRRKDSAASSQRFTAPAHKSVLLTPLEMESHVERALRILPPILSPQCDPSLIAQPLPINSADGGNRSTSSRQASGETGGEDDSSPAGFETDGCRSHVEAASGGEEKSDDSSAATARIQAASVAAAHQQAHAEQLRLARISARCSLLLQSGRPIEAVLLRLRMADEERDSSQEEEAIALAGCIVRDHEIEARESSQARQARGGGDTDLGGGLQNALRAELFHHLFTHWLQRQFRLQYTAAQQRCGSAFASSLAADVSYLSSSPLPTLDPRISALMPPNYTAAIYLELVEHQRRKFSQEIEHAKLDGMVHRQPTPPSTPTKAKQAASAAAAAATEAQAPPDWPEMSPVLLPSMMTGPPAVDLPMSCLLNELKHFAQKL